MFATAGADGQRKHETRREVFTKRVIKAFGGAI